MGSLGLRTLLTAALWVAVLGTVVALHALHPPEQLSLGGARWTVTAQDPPAPPVPGIRLPHQWRDASPTLRAARYATTVRLAAAPSEPWAIYLPSLNMNAAVSVNGTRIGDGGRLREPLSRHSFRPLLFALPAGVLRSGDNEVVVELHSGPPGTGFLQEVDLGPHAELRPYHDLRYLLKVQFVQGLVVAVAVLGLITLGVWWARRDERVYLWYAVTSAAFLLYCLCFAATDLPLPSRWWDWLRDVSIGWMIAAITVFGVHFLGLSRPRLAAALVGFSVFGPLALAGLILIVPQSLYTLLVRAWSDLILAFGVYPVSLFVRELWRRADARSFWMLASASSLLLGGAHDSLLKGGLIDPYNGFYFYYMVPLPISVFTWVLGLRFLAAMRESELLNRELNQRVSVKQAELERAYAELRRSEEQRLLADERERIQRDMHDGLGGTLVSTLAGMEMEGEGQSSAAHSLRATLDDLRLMIYSLDPGSSTLRAALSTLHERLARLGEDAGLRVQWRMEGLPADLALERGHTLQLMRIVQEAFTNTVKHAGAGTFAVMAAGKSRDGRAGVSIDIRDDGRGFDAARPAKGGYGLANMRLRAQKIGGHLGFEPADPGARIVLWVPAGSFGDSPT